MPNVTWQSMPPNLGAVNLPVQNDSLSSSIFPFIIIFLCYGLCYDSYKLGQDQLCSIKFKEALFKDTVVLTRLDQKHVGYGSRVRERESWRVSRQRRASGLNSHPPPHPQPNIGLCQVWRIISLWPLYTGGWCDHWGGGGGVSTLRTPRLAARLDIPDNRAGALEQPERPGPG